MVSNSPECYFWPCFPLELGWYVQSVSRRKLEFGKIVGKRSFFKKSYLKSFVLLLSHFLFHPRGSGIIATPSHSRTLLQWTPFSQVHEISDIRLPGQNLHRRIPGSPKVQVASRQSPGLARIGWSRRGPSLSPGRLLEEIWGPGRKSVCSRRTQSTLGHGCPWWLLHACH